GEYAGPFESPRKARRRFAFWALEWEKPAGAGFSTMVPRRGLAHVPPARPGEYAGPFESPRKARRRFAFWALEWEKPAGAGFSTMVPRRGLEPPQCCHR